MQSCIHWCKIGFFQKECQLIIILEMPWSRFCLSVLENWPGTACYSWDGQKEEQRCHISPFQPHICIFQLAFMLLPHHSYLCFSFSEEVSLTKETTMKLILLQKVPHYVYSGQSIQKVPYVGHCSPPSLLSRPNGSQYPDLPGQLLISKVAKSAHKTGHKGHVSNTQAEDHKLNYHIAHFCIAVKIIQALLKHLRNPHIWSYSYRGHLIFSGILSSSSSFDWIICSFDHSKTLLTLNIQDTCFH